MPIRRHGLPYGAGSPGAAKIPTTPTQVADLAAAVDGGSGTQRNYSPSNQGRHVSSIYTGSRYGSCSKWGQWAMYHLFMQVSPMNSRELQFLNMLALSKAFLSDSNLSNCADIVCVHWLRLHILLQSNWKGHLCEVLLPVCSIHNW